jgi:poly-gamma-glutamate capsule biosynthesis protein CapA/YwtB (metallophosphatase superfamily)
MGVAAPAIMRELARVAEESSVERFYTIGEDVRILNQCISDRSRVAPHFQTLEKLESALRNELVPGDVVVLKGDVRPENISLRRLADRLTARPNTDKPDLSTTPGVRLVIGGDTYFGESYQAKRARESDINYLETFGYDYSGEKLAPLFRRADYAVANLECALTTLKRSALMGRKSFVLGGKPDESVRALKNLNIGGVLLGNNHAMDYLGPGLAETLASLEKARIQTAGGGKGRAAAQQPIRKTFDVGGIPFRVAIVSAYEFNENHDDMGFYAGEESLGINNINTRRLSEQIAGLKADGYFVIVSPHWGTNYSFRTFSQSSMATRIIGCGADLILGHGAHMMNEIVRTDGVWVVYSLGNLIFNSEGEYVARQLPPYSLVAELEFARKGAGVVGSMNLYPIVSCNQMTQFQPTFVDDDQFQHVVALLSGTKYDRKEFEDSIVLRQVDGRHCISMKLF